MVEEKNQVYAFDRSDVAHPIQKSVKVLGRTKTDEKQKKYSKKGAYLYKFNEDKYKEKVDQGDSLIFKPIN